MNDGDSANTVSLLDESTLSRYISNKIYLAKSMTQDEYRKLRGFERSAKEDEPGYVILYPDGYISWSPAPQFEATSTRTDDMNFGMALVALKKGFKVARKDWNGKNMYIWLQGGSVIHRDSCRNVTLEDIADSNSDKQVTIHSHIDMKLVDGTVLIGWSATQTDMLSDRWFIVD